MSRANRTKRDEVRDYLLVYKEYGRKGSGLGMNIVSIYQHTLEDCAKYMKSKSINGNIYIGIYKLNTKDTKAATKIVSGMKRKTEHERYLELKAKFEPE